MSTAASPSNVKASPIAKRLAEEYGIDLLALMGSGPSGRIVKADVEAAASAAGRADTRASSPDATRPIPREAADRESDTSGSEENGRPSGSGAGAKGETEAIKLTRTQTLIASRMAESKATVPEFTVAVEVDAEALFALREQFRDEVNPLPSANDFVIKAAGRALREHPHANGSYKDGRFELYSRVNVGMAVAAPDSLVVPTIFDADQKPISQIARETRALAQRVREGTVTHSELAAGTFTVSNLGMFGVTRFTAVINPPQAAILAVGSAISRAVPDGNDGFVARRLMELTLSADHRILYGAEAAAFVATLRDLLEQPLRLML